jgi:hypothetical protein
MRLAVIAAALAAVAFATPSAAQQPDGLTLVGTWSGQRPGQNGMDRISEYYGPDGSFVSVLQLGNGTMTRVWGAYRLSPYSPTQGRLEFQAQGVLPRQICAQAPGFPVRCGPNQTPVSNSADIQFTSPASFQTNGMTMMRDPHPYLLQQPVPEQLVLAVPAPVNPGIPQPMPPAHITPNGPGVGIAEQNHDNAQEFIKQYMRGCAEDRFGRPYACEQ